MRLSLNTLTTFLNHFGGRKVLSSSRDTYLPNIFARRNPRVVARSARLRAAKSAGRIRSKHRHAATAANTNRPSSTGTAHGDKPQYRHAKTRRLKPLRRCNTVLTPQPPTHPQLPGAYVLEPSFVVPGYPELDDRHLPPLVVQKLFFDALYEGRQALLRAEEERWEVAQMARLEAEQEYARLLEQDLKKAQAAHRRAEEAEYARLLEEDRKKAEAAHQKAEFARLLEEDQRKAQEAHRRAVEQEEKERQRRAEQERSVQNDLAKKLRVYEEKWAALRSNVVGTEQLGFCDIPWPLFENVQGVGDITAERVVAFVCHPLHEHIQGPGEGQAKSLRSEMLRWHPDKFEGKVLDKVVEGDREAVREAAGHVARILTRFSAQKR